MFPLHHVLYILHFQMREVQMICFLSKENIYFKSLHLLQKHINFLEIIEALNIDKTITTLNLIIL